MYEELYRYLLQHKQLPVPGIGTFLLERKPASIDFPNKQMKPPMYRFVMKTTELIPSRKLFAWLGAAFNTGEEDAITRFNDFVLDMKKQVAAGDIIHWNGVGTIQKGVADEITFSPLAEMLIPEQPVPAAKVLRQKAEHTVRVGEEEKTSAEMTEMLSQPKEKRSLWWAWALAIGLSAVIFISWYFSEHGLEVSSTANGKKAVLEEATTTYRPLP